ncbi:ShlB/FhaC/HecB family hemolysin secretion/activation protein [Halieaceae bacterium IMCC14734]|uniref:ShlB/FhaC/HecB family hemolysin secretion/activation protein n=1 Tax=Candidatus Litorirhabdus singularis TaxID=2518993 RepID=A0ABT3TIE0_9GAMM|nr:POTRA domain-containing protein [Candidatus Litorirhabdus singularis]MCX2981769.1 ShlB/FhaC/HecB family hemolysin secretion/activation protein [Candidatus Litorirhabdus singularis]
MNFCSQLGRSLVLVVFSSSVSSQVLPPAIDPAGQEQDLMRREQILRQREELLEQTREQEEETSVEAQSELDEETFVLTSVRFSQSELLSEDELRSLVEPYIGQETGLSDLNRLVAAINGLYRQKGIFTAAALLPQQEVDNGTVVIRLVEGQLGDVLVEGNSYVAEDFVEGWLNPAEGERLEDMNLLEVDILRYNRVNDSRLQAELRAGKAFGLTDLVLRVDEVAQNNLQVFADNYGFESSGEEEVGAIYRRYGLISGADRAWVYALATEGNLAFSANYNAPLKASRWRLGSTVSLNETEVVSGDFKDVSVEGSSNSISLESSFLAHSATNRWINLLGTAYYSNSESTVAGEIISDYEIVRLDAGADFTWVGSGWQWSARQMFGWVSTKNKAVADSDQDFMMLSGDSSIFYRLGASNWYGLAQFDYQYTDEDLIPGAVAYSMGGATSVRGYKAGFISGDSAFRLSLEAHYGGFQLFGGNVDAFLFYDAGKVYALDLTQPAQAVGAGLGWSGGPGFSFTSTIAHPTEDVLPDQDDWVFYGRFSWNWSD